MNNCHTCHNVSCNYAGSDPKQGPCEEYIPSAEDSFTVKDMRVMGIYCAVCGFLIGVCVMAILIHFL